MKNSNAHSGANSTPNSNDKNCNDLNNFSEDNLSEHCAQNMQQNASVQSELKDDKNTACVSVDKNIDCINAAQAGENIGESNLSAQTDKKNEICDNAPQSNTNNKPIKIENTQPQNGDEDKAASIASDAKSSKRNKKGGKRKKKRRVPLWLSWGLTVLVLSFLLSVLFSLLTEIAIKDSPAYICIIVLVVLLILNIGCDIIANAVLSCSAEGFNAMASRKIRGAKRAVSFCKNAEKIGSIFSDVIGDICGIVSGSAGAVLAGYYAVNGSLMGTVISILISAIIGGLTVGGKAFGKPIALKYNSQIAFGFAKFTTFFVREK